MKLNASPVAGVARLAHHAKNTASWVLPGAVLALLPKCPACFAACAMVWTGIGLSLPVASGLRMILSLTCLVALVFLVWRKLRPYISGRSASMLDDACPECPSSFVARANE